MQRSVAVCNIWWNITWQPAPKMPAAKAKPFTSFSHVSCCLISSVKLRGRGGYPDCAVMQHAMMHYELFDFVLPASCIILQAKPLHFLCLLRCCIYPSCNVSICRNGPCLCACMYVCPCMCVYACEHWVIGNVVFKGGDCSGPCGLQADKVMMAPAFSASSSQSY